MTAFAEKVRCLTNRTTRDGRLLVSATDLTGGGSIDVEFETEAVMTSEQVEERSSALRLLAVS